jgi:hypothetical protein
MILVFTISKDWIISIKNGSRTFTDPASLLTV